MNKFIRIGTILMTKSNLRSPINAKISKDNLYVIIEHEGQLISFHFNYCADAEFGKRIYVKKAYLKLEEHNRIKKNIKYKRLGYFLMWHNSCDLIKDSSCFLNDSWIKILKEIVIFMFYISVWKISKKYHLVIEVNEGQVKSVKFPKNYKCQFKELRKLEDDFYKNKQGLKKNTNIKYNKTEKNITVSDIEVAKKESFDLNYFSMDKIFREINYDLYNDFIKTLKKYEENNKIFININDFINFWFDRFLYNTTNLTINNETNFPTLTFLKAYLASYIPEYYSLNDQSLKDTTKVKKPRKSCENCRFNRICIKKYKIKRKDGCNSFEVGAAIKNDISQYDSR
ncbi:hypothetical protein [Natranaerobius thermophilus]|uniref:Uncharacterized protein n=1 Tax=Natranaerobius thermophilus (strain ATCC BAA-1301 / DSM 18059 / JW/NM-WN-LF) TaxID=457570 RepID=B2A407_NATTJ|nr:hypothetical protein [Natranaerobius thermophilus]ACB85109.1 hypothetical protein Nther_1531 [Natranaerobius thermophilus JW/NM-WN-LF]